MLEFFNKKKILITGHTGFKGSWLSSMLIWAGAEVSGYSLEPPTSPSLFELINLGSEMDSWIGDVRDYNGLLSVIKSVKPEIVIHMAAQPIVRTSYVDPQYTYETNVMGTVNICEAIRNTDYVKSFLNVTTDKVYLNREWERGYVEDDSLDGFDPYSNSKSCSELVTHSYKNSFFDKMGVAVSTARAGNVIGGGDFSVDRIIPDCVRAVSKGEQIIVRNPNSIRPYQHVLEPLFVYLMIVREQFENPSKAGYYNVGPDDKDCVTTGELATIFCNAWGEGASWKTEGDGGPHEANLLKLDCSKLKETFGWSPAWNVETAIEKTVEWWEAFFEEGNKREALNKIMMEQIQEYRGNN